MSQRAPAQKVDGDGKHDRPDGEGVDVDHGAALADAINRLRRDADRQCSEKAGLSQRRHRLDLGVAERMIGVGGLVGFAHGEEGERARDDIERIVPAFGKKRERAGGEPGRELDDGQGQADGDRGRRRARLQGREGSGRIRRLRSQCKTSDDWGLVRCTRRRYAPKPAIEQTRRGKPMEYMHTMIRVTDLKATIAFFELMGFVETRRIDNDKGRYTLVFLAAPGDVGAGEARTRRRLSSSPTIGTRRPIRAAAISVISPIASTTSTRPAPSSRRPA